MNLFTVNFKYCSISTRYILFFINFLNILVAPNKPFFSENVLSQFFGELSKSKTM